VDDNGVASTTCVRLLIMWFAFKLTALPPTERVAMVLRSDPLLELHMKFEEFEDLPYT